MNRPLVEAELDRHMPERAKMRPGDTDEFRTAWPSWSGGRGTGGSRPGTRSVQDGGRPQTKAPCTGASPPWTQRLELHDGQAVAARLPA
ncbi:hypothetical protein ACIBP6_29705 [Nonomuraea terrae]|uniref:hypothetical protein n=1 Tax=Nonomuraea terrae TaxID=2530383 RepID=UPI003791C3B6